MLSDVLRRVERSRVISLSVSLHKGYLKHKSNFKTQHHKIATTADDTRNTSKYRLGNKAQVASKCENQGYH